MGAVDKSFNASEACSLSVAACCAHSEEISTGLVKIVLDAIVHTKDSKATIFGKRLDNGTLETLMEFQCMES
jgi:hypothetical protein